MRIQGPGAARLSISAGGQSRVIEAVSSGTVNLVGMTIRDGFVHGTAVSGGAAGSGLPGSPGNYAAGGCIQLFNGALTLDQIDVRNCVAQASAGGDGGSGTAGSGLSTGGTGGAGGNGGSAYGGAIHFVTINGDLILRETSVTNAQALAAPGGRGGDGGSGFFKGTGGLGGNGGGASGGAIFSAGTHLSIINSTIASSSAVGSAGGNGGSGDANLTTATGGDGGAGGNADGGLITLVGDSYFPNTDAELQFTTLAAGTVGAGAAGNGGQAATPGAAGAAGSATGAALFSNGVSALYSTVVIGVAVVPLCHGGEYGFYAANLDEDSSCEASVHGTLAQDFLPPDADQSRPTYLPRWHRGGIDAASSCNDAGAQAVATDEHGTPRPQGSACDLGAIEADYIFVDGLD
jgi:hypothetical protein